MSLSLVVPLPNWPQPFWPQHRTTPPVQAAQAWPSPTAMEVAFLTFGIADGKRLPVVWSYGPQHLTVPSVRSAQEPPEMAVAWVTPDTSTEMELDLLVPSPSMPSMFSPQHRTVPSPSKAQVCASEEAMAVALLIPTTTTGVGLTVVVPLPSCPA